MVRDSSERSMSKVVGVCPDSAQQGKKFPVIGCPALLRRGKLFRPVGDDLFLSVDLLGQNIPDGCC